MNMPRLLAGWYAAWLGSLFGQYADPHGLPGQIVSSIMLRGNGASIAWTVELMAIEASDRILDLGCGPGLGLTLMAARACRGYVVGIDHSALMVRQARGRNARLLELCRAEVTLSDAATLPYPHGSFDRVCAAHVIYYWSDPVEVLLEIKRVLRPGGMLAIAFRSAERAPRIARHGMQLSGATLYTPSEVSALLRRAGFGEVQVHTRVVYGHDVGICVLASKGDRPWQSTHENVCESISDKVNHVGS
jgi:SAM-dependent methyltransferase